MIARDALECCARFIDAHGIILPALEDRRDEFPLRLHLLRARKERLVAANGIQKHPFVRIGRRARLESIGVIERERLLMRLVVETRPLDPERYRNALIRLYP